MTAKIMIIKNLKIQMLARNSLKMCVGAGFEISLTLVKISIKYYVLLKIIPRKSVKLKQRHANKEFTFLY